MLEKVAISSWKPHAEIGCQVQQRVALQNLFGEESSLGRRGCLGAGLRASCEDDIARLCAEEKEQIDNSQGAGADSKVILCLEVCAVLCYAGPRAEGQL